MTQTTSQTPGTEGAAAPQPGTPEYTAAMVAAYNGQNPQPGQPATPQTPAPTEEAKKEPEPTPEKKADEPPVTNTEPPKDLADFYSKGLHEQALNDKGEFKPEVREQLKAFGLPETVLDYYQGLTKQVAELQAQVNTQTQAKAEAALHDAAGGKANFDALIAKGKTVLSKAEQDYFDEAFNGPLAASAVKLLQQRLMVQPREPSLALPSATAGGGVAGYASQAEMVRDMADPKYRTDPAFRQQVVEKLRNKRF